MNYFIFVWCLLSTALAINEKKISLEDIERDSYKPNKVDRVAQPQSPPNYSFVPVKTAADYARQQPKQIYSQPQYIPQQYSQPHTYQPVQQPQVPQQYYYQQIPQRQQYYYQQYENVPYITENSVSQQQQHQQQPAYNTQYVYLQQFASPSNNIQAVIDPKGNINYVMYVPTHIPQTEETQNYETVYVNVDQSPKDYEVPESKYQTAQPILSYTQPTEPQPKTRYFTTKHEPKSLLDSYIPSYLQIQYMKQQQAARAANAINHSVKNVKKLEFTSSNTKDTYSPNPGVKDAIRYEFQIPSD